MIEYHVTYTKNGVRMRKIRPNLEWALTNYKDAVEWQERVPAADIKDIKLIKREYTEEDITPCV